MLIQSPHQKTLAVVWKYFQFFLFYSECLKEDICKHLEKAIEMEKAIAMNAELTKISTLSYDSHQYHESPQYRGIRRI